jgi:hypothetical protein
MPVSALMFDVAFSGDVTWNGVVSGRDSKRYLEVKVYSKKPLPIEIEFSNAWPSILEGHSTDEIELVIRINKKNNAVKMNFAWGEYKNPSIYKYVCKARGTASISKTGDIDITITQVEILEREKPNSFIERYYSESESIVFRISFI